RRDPSMSAPSCNAGAQPSRTAKRTLTFPIAALVALAACSPVAAPSATNGPGSSASNGPGSSPSTVRRSPEATRYDGPLILFTRVRSDDEAPTFTIGIDGSRETELTDVHDCCGIWSPDGTIIVVPDGTAASRVLPA